MTTTWTRRGLTAAVIIAASSRPIFGQAVAVAVADGGEPTEQGNGFVVRKEAKPTLDALEDFDRFRDKRAWEKAFGALDKVASTDPGRLVSAGGGFYVPTTERILAEQLSLPPDGRQAFRLFNDAHAKQLLAAAASQPDEVNALKNLVGRYFITSVGDQAADRLGDALFERGDFIAAEHAWRMIIDSFPDSSLSVPLLQTKRMIALNRAGDTAAADAIAAGIDTSATVHLGGRDTKIVDVLASLKTAAVSNGPGALNPSTAVVQGTDADRPATSGPVWQIPLVDPGQLKAMKDQMAQNGWGFMISQLGQTIPSSAVDGKRVYVNYGGVCFGADLRTGKVIWQTDSLGDTTNRMRTMTQMGTWYSNASFSTTLSGQNVIFTRGANPNGQGNSNSTTLLCLNGTDGKMVWRSDRGPLSAFSIAGKPAVDGAEIFVIGHRTNAADVSLLCVDSNTGAIKWSTAMGEFTASPNYQGNSNDPAPSILRRADKVDVLTNNGAVLEIDTGSHNVEWAFVYPTGSPGQTYYYYNTPATPPNASGAMIADAGTLYFKERTNDTLYAIDPAKHQLKWKRPVDEPNTLVAIDGGHLLLSGTSAQCIDLETRDLLWDTPLSTATGDARPMLSGRKMVSLGSKGVEVVDDTSGDITTTVPGGGRSGGDGGDLWKTNDRMITVSPSTITAYAVVPPGGK